MAEEQHELTESDHRRSRRNKIGVALFFVVIAIMSIVLASLLRSIVKPVDGGEGTSSAPIEQAEPADAP